MADKYKLNPRQELFCKLYATNEEFFGNGVASYIEAFKVDQKKRNWYKSACASSSRLLSNVKILERINTLLENNGLNDAFIDKQLLFLATQHTDFGAKLGAIKEYNTLKQRIIKKIDHTTKGQKLDFKVVSYKDISNG